MNLFKIFLVLFTCLNAFSGEAQELPPIQNFTSLDYNSGNQNWSISQSNDKLIYVANNGGLLEYNGANWTLYPSPNETIMRSVKVIDNKIYTGCYMEFGYWQRNPLGILEYTSLSKNLAVKIDEDEEFWGITGIEDLIVFQSLNRIYIYDTKKREISYVDSSEIITKMYEVDETIYFQRLNKGIYKIENGREVVFLDNDIFKSNEVINIFEYDKGLLILTRNNGFFKYLDGVLGEMNSSINDFANLSIYNAVKLRNNHFALGTISNGLLYLDDELKLIYEINQSNGLLNNTVLSVFEDMEGNIWSGLDNGIGYVNINAPIKVFKDKKGNLGSVYAAVIFQGKLYLGTNQGLFYKKVATKDEFSLIEGTQGQVWSLKVIQNTLFCGHHKGTFIVNAGNASQVSEIQGTWNIDELDNDSSRIIQGNYDGLYVLHKRDDKWQLKNKIEGFNNSSRYFEVTEDHIFVNHEYKGVFNLTVNEDFSKVKEISIDTTLKGANSSVTEYNGSVLYAYKKGIFEYNKEQKKFIKDSLLSSIYSEDEYVSGRIVRNDDKFWVFTKYNLSFVTSSKLTNELRIKTIPLTLDERRDVVEYENIVNVGGLDQYILGTSTGYITVAINDLSVKEFKVSLNTISNGINKNHITSHNLINKDKKGFFDSNENNMRLSYYAPEYYKYYKPVYQYQLVGLYEEWSDWSEKPSEFFENLPAGDYTFNVRARIGDRISSNVADYSFSISKPWYISNVMLVVYAVGVFLFSIFMHNVYKQYYSRQRKKLVEENKRELTLVKLQNEKEIIRLRNEQLQNDYKSKSNELAASTMSIVTKNELLTKIKEHLLKIKDQKSVEPVVKIIDKSLDHDENWEFFKEAFDNADSEFFKKIKNLHSDLSPNDLKLCAYLRLNLSSKEIAPLFNISPRSVEIKRYRLRKKMNLVNNENLTEYILSI